MNSRNIVKFVAPLEENNLKKYGNQIPKRKRQDEMDHVKADTKLDLQQPEIKRRQPQSIFRPWSDDKDVEIIIPQQTTTKSQSLPVPSSTKKDIIPNNTNVSPPQTKIPLPQSPVLLSPYQMAVQQQQHQSALAMQQAMYQRQLLVAHLWSRQRNFQQYQLQQQQQQQMMMHQHHMRQQMLAFEQKLQGHK